MKPIVLCYEKCSTCRKAIQWLDARGAAYSVRPIKEEHPDCRLVIVSLDPITRRSADVELIYVLDFLKALWDGEVF